MTSHANPVARQRELMLETYGGAIGQPVEEVPTPALLLDIDAAERNIAKMATELAGLPAQIRPHIKVHKSTELAKRQVAAGAIGLSTATVWEAVALAWAGLDDIFVVNTISHPEKIRVLAELARHQRVLVASDNAGNVSVLAEAARTAGSHLGVLVEVDTGMDRAGVDDEADAISLVKHIESYDELVFEGLTGYEGHCSLESDGPKRIAKQRLAMDIFLGMADKIESLGIPCPIRSAGGTATWQLTAERDGITEIQAGSYVLMDNFHGRMVGGFEQAATIATTVISHPPDRVIVDAGNKSVGVGGGPSLREAELEAMRFDEEHGIFITNPEVKMNVGSWVRMIPGYAPATINMYDAYYVERGGRVIDVWPVFPRGPGHNGLIVGP